MSTQNHDLSIRYACLYFPGLAASCQYIKVFLLYGVHQTSSQEGFYCFHSLRLFSRRLYGVHVPGSKLVLVSDTSQEKLTICSGQCPAAIERVQERRTKKHTINFRISN